jgi:hypothetical protein
MSLNLGGAGTGPGGSSSSGVGIGGLSEQSLSLAASSLNPTISMSQLIQNFTGTNGSLNSLGSLIPTDFDFFNECASSIQLDKNIMNLSVLDFHNHNGQQSTAAGNGLGLSSQAPMNLSTTNNSVGGAQQQQQQLQQQHHTNQLHHHHHQQQQQQNQIQQQQLTNGISQQLSIQNLTGVGQVASQPSQLLNNSQTLQNSNHMQHQQPQQQTNDLVEEFWFQNLQQQHQQQPMHLHNQQQQQQPQHIHNQFLSSMQQQQQHQQQHHSQQHIQAAHLQQQQSQQQQAQHHMQHHLGNELQLGNQAMLASMMPPPTQSQTSSSTIPSSSTSSSSNVNSSSSLLNVRPRDFIINYI